MDIKPAWSAPIQPNTPYTVIGNQGNPALIGHRINQ
jgi:hypothetical protein